MNASKTYLGFSVGQLLTLEDAGLAPPAASVEGLARPLTWKTTWTSGKGQEYMLWNNVESKPYGFYPLAWDLRILAKLGVPTEGTCGIAKA
mgnify:CR=1 FL=1